MPFAGFKDFKDCLRKAKAKGIKNPKAWCGKIKARVEGKKKRKRSKKSRK